VRKRPFAPLNGIRGIAAALCVTAVVLSPVSSKAETIRVEVKSLAFSPANVTAHVGDRIEWANADFIAHTATGKNHEFDVSLPANKAGGTLLNKPGTIEYFCRFHPNMTGQIIVQNK
jgi:plastocyanin